MLFEEVIEMGDLGKTQCVCNIRNSRNCGSKLSLLPIDRSNITAGFPSEKVGTNEIPLFVTVTAPPK